MEPTNGSHPIVRDFENCYLSPHQHAPYALSFPKVSVLLSVIYNIITSGLCGISSIFNISVCLTRKFFEKPARYCMYYIQSLKSWLLRISTFFHVSMRLEYFSLQYFQLKRVPPPPFTPFVLCSSKVVPRFWRYLSWPSPSPPLGGTCASGESTWDEYEWVMAHICMSHGTEMKESWHTYVWVTVRRWRSHGTHMYMSWYTYVCAMALFHLSICAPPFHLFVCGFFICAPRLIRHHLWWWLHRYGE